MNNQFHSNQIFYVKDIGYARILADKIAKEDEKIKQNKEELPPPIIKTLSQPKQQTDEQQEDVQFDPNMFNIEPQRTISKNGHEVNAELINIANQRKVSIDHRQGRQAAKQIKIIGLKLQNTNFQIFVQQSQLLRKINFRVKPMLDNQRKEIQIQIDIIKTIDVLKTYIFDKIGQQIGYYSDIRIFSTIPILQELSLGSKTIWQCGLKNNSKLIITGKFYFVFKSIEAGHQVFYTLSNGNCTITGAKPIKKQEVVQQVPQQQNTQTTSNIIQNNQKTTNTDTASSTNLQVQATAIKPKEKQILKEQPLHLFCNGRFRTGIHYWQIKLDKIEQLKNDKALLFLGICLKNKQNKLIAHWGYDPVKLRKIQLISQKKQLMEQKQRVSEVQQSDENSSDDEYGAKVKNGDTIGVLLILKQKMASLVFYKNSICFQECYEINLQKFQPTQHISPFIMIRGECQLTLDSKAAEPLDVYRRK